ncbi:hypothetical protein GCM10009740_02310 [Terrabacter terrae]|uniref:Uncharacterized protein n=1 Tax=Terrabacter terrae TaxID=318434 RepID=A0ABN2TRS1_9MICO
MLGVLRDEEVAGSNPVTPTIPQGLVESDELASTGPFGVVGPAPPPVSREGRDAAYDRTTLLRAEVSAGPGMGRPT